MYFWERESPALLNEEGRILRIINGDADEDVWGLSASRAFCQTRGIRRVRVTWCTSTIPRYLHGSWYLLCTLRSVV